MQSRWERINPAYVLILPSLLFFILFVFFPLVLEIYLGLSTWAPGSPTFLGMTFNGFQNVEILLQDENYLRALVNTFVFLVVDINVKLILALGVALALNREFRGRTVARGLLVIIWALPAVPSYLVWAWIYHPTHGFLNFFLRAIGLISDPIIWLGDTRIALYAVIWAHIWKFVPFWMLTFLAALQSIPIELYDAAKIDGAGTWNTFRHVTFPMMKTILIINYTLSFVWTMGEFASVWILTRGGPGYATHIVGSFAYFIGFVLQNLNIAICCFLIILPLVVTIIAAILRTGILKMEGA